MKLDELQLAVMQALWRLGSGSVSQLRDELAKQGRDLALNTVGTVLSRLEKKEAVTHNAEGRQFVYVPLISEQDSRQNVLKSLIGQFFGGSSTALVNHLVKENEFDSKELEDIKKLLDNK